jgi:hypothetical protein
MTAIRPGLSIPIQKYRTLTLLQILVDGRANSHPIAIVVDDEDPTTHEPRDQVDQFVLRGLVPVGVQAKESNLLGRVLGHGLFDSPLDNVDSLQWVVGCSQTCSNFLERCDSPQNA